MMLIEVKFELGSTVYLKTDKNQDERIVTDFSVNMNGIRYGLTCGTTATWHYEMEISCEKNVLKSMSE